MKRVVFTVGAVLRGDDAAGPMLAKMMEDQPVKGWDIIDGGQMPEDMLAVVRRTRPDFLLLVDAAHMGAPVGTMSLLSDDEVVSDYLITTHSLPLTFLLEELRSVCSQVVFLGIQPGQTEFMAPLSPAVLASVEALYRILSDLSEKDCPDLLASFQSLIPLNPSPQTEPSAVIQPQTKESITKESS